MQGACRGAVRKPPCTWLVRRFLAEDWRSSKLAEQARVFSARPNDSKRSAPQTGDSEASFIRPADRRRHRAGEIKRSGTDKHGLLTYALAGQQMTREFLDFRAFFIDRSLKDGTIREAGEDKHEKSRALQARCLRGFVLKLRDKERQSLSMSSTSLFGRDSAGYYRWLEWE
jgi:hypothetical protein